MPRRARPLVLAAALAVAIAGCGSDVGGGAGDRLRVVATTTQVADLVRAVGGDRIELTRILDPNTDPHAYEPRPDDIVRTAQARVAFVSGVGLDAWIDDVIEQSGSEARVVELGDQVPVKLDGDESHQADAHEDEHEHGDVDPHWWHDPRNAIAAVAAIREALTRADPAHRAEFAAAADAYTAKLRALDAGIAACVDQLDPDERKLVTDHDAFGYLAARYGLEVVGAAIPSQSTRAQASAGELARLIETIRRERVQAVFPESAVNDKLVRAIARESGATVAGSLYSDALGAEGSRGATYLGMEQANADAIVRGLSGGARGCKIAGL